MAHPKFEIGQYVKIIESEDTDGATRDYIDTTDYIDSIESSPRYGWVYELESSDQSFAESELEAMPEANIEIIVENGVVKEVEFHNMKPIKWIVK